MRKSQVPGCIYVNYTLWYKRYSLMIDSVSGVWSLVEKENRLTCIAISNLHNGRIISWCALTNGSFCFGNTLKMLAQIRIFRDQPKMINRSCVNLACSCGNQATFLVDCCCWSFPVRCSLNVHKRSSTNSRPTQTRRCCGCVSRKCGSTR